MKALNLKIEYCNDCPYYSTYKSSYNKTGCCNNFTKEDRKVSKIIYDYEITRNSPAGMPQKVSIPDFCELPEA